MREAGISVRVLVLVPVLMLGAGLGLGLACVGGLPDSVCGDGWVQPKVEDCDYASAELSGESPCPTGGPFICSPSCELECLCGDGKIDPGEECDPGALCVSDSDCELDERCYLARQLCLPVGPNDAPLTDCRYYESLAFVPQGGDKQTIDKLYAQGRVGGCTPSCRLERTECSFCGDGELDGASWDLIGYQNGELIEASLSDRAETCDSPNGEVALEQLYDHCRPICLSDQEEQDPDFGELPVRCKFDCSEDCHEIKQFYAKDDDEDGGTGETGDDLPDVLIGLECCIESPECMFDGPKPDLPCCPD